MRFSYAESMTDPSFYAPLARAAEEAGYDSMVVPDSICYPLHASSWYPFTPDGSREFLEDKPFIEPFSLIPALGAVTTRLRFVTFVVKLPVRSPVLVAKQATSTAVLTGNRLVLGVGTSPWREDYEVLGVPWADRGRRMDEELAIILGLSAGGTSNTTVRSSTSRRSRLPRCRASPSPSHRRALRCRPPPRRPGGGRVAARRGRADLPGLLARLGEFRRRAGTAGRPFEVHAIPAGAYRPDGVRRLKDQGVTDAIVGFRWPYQTGPDREPLADKLAKLRGFAEDVIAKVR